MARFIGALLFFAPLKFSRFALLILELFIMPSAPTAATRSKEPGDKRQQALEYVQSGVDFWAIGSRRKAWIQFTKASETDPNCPEAYFEKGRVQQTLGNLSEAAKWYDRALEAAEAPGRKGIRAIRDVVRGTRVLRGITSWQSRSWETAGKEFQQAVAEGWPASPFRTPTTRYPARRRESRIRSR